MESEETLLFDGARGGAWESTLMDIEGETVKRLDSSNRSDKTTAVATAAAQTGLGSNGSDEMTTAAVAKAWIVVRRRQQQYKLVIRRRQQRDNSNCGSNGRDANLAWRKRRDSETARQQQ